MATSNNSEARRLRTAYLIGPFIVGVFALILATSRGLVAYLDLDDLFITFDAMWRASLSETPHLDFPSPIGQAYYGVFGLITHLAPVSPSTLLKANAFVAIGTAGVSWALLQRRMSPVFFTLAVLTAGGVALSPRDTDTWLTGLSFVAPYNTWAWGGFMPLALAAIVRPIRPSPRLELVDGVLLGLLLSWLFYLKMTFFLPAAALLFLGAVLRQLPVRAALLASVILMICVASVELTAHNNGAYLADLIQTSKVEIGAAKRRMLMLAAHLGVAAGFGAVFIACLRMVARSEPQTAWARAAWRPAIFAAILFAVGAAIATENHPEWLNVFCFAPLIAGGELASRRWEALAHPLAARDLAARVASLTLVLVCAVRPAMDLAAVAVHATWSWGHDFTSLTSLGQDNRDLLLHRKVAIAAEAGRFAQTSSDWRAEDVGTNAMELVEAFKLLRDAHLNQQVIFAVDMSNPYPMLFRAEPTPRSLIWWDGKRSFSQTVHPTESMLCPVGVVVKPRDQLWRTAKLWSVYGGTIEREFRLIETSAHWQIWVRARACAAQN